MLTVAGLEAAYGRAQALFGLDLAVGRGEVVALIGRNGAGKSTTLKVLAGLIRTRAGRIRFDGTDIRGLPAHRIARLGLGYVPEERRIFASLTVEENLLVGRQPPREGLPTWTMERLFDLFPNLAGMRGRLGGRISGGEQQMLSLARTLMGNPRMVLLDEPSQGLAPKIVEDMAEKIAELKALGLTVLLSEQNLRFVGRIADRAVVIETGRMRWTGSMTDFLADTDAQHAYLEA